VIERLLALVLGTVLFAAAAMADEQGSIAARVNGTPIPTEVVDTVVRNVIASRARPPDSEEIERLTLTALDSLIDLELLYQEARARKIVVSDKEVDAEIARTQRRFASKADFEAALKASGLSLQRLRDDTRKTLMVNRLLATLPGAGTAVSADDINRFYDQHRDELAQPSEVRVSEIFVRVAASGSVADRAAALERAKAVLAQLRAGGDFAALARSHSDDGATAKHGGDRGFVHRGQLPAALDDAVFALQPGQVSEIVESPEGYHIVTVTEIRPPRTAALADVRGHIAKLLEEDERNRRQAAFVKTLREKAKIEVLTAASN